MTILDNRDSSFSVGECLRRQLLVGGTRMLRIVSAYFTVYAYQALSQQLDKVDAMRLMYSDPGALGEIYPTAKRKQQHDLTEEGLFTKHVLRQARAARECEAWVEQKAQIRTLKPDCILHGKMYHLERHPEPDMARAEPDMAILGCSNFTHHGLGLVKDVNRELNLRIDDKPTCDDLKRWFDILWDDQKSTVDAKQLVLTALSRLSQNYSPERFYFKTLSEVFREQLAARKATSERLGDARLEDTQIWQALYTFQRDGVTGIINRLERHGGCILADSVGLGKTYTALAVIRYFEAKNQRVLVLCPKKLSENWKCYPTQHGQHGNPFKDDNLRFTVLHHTDLSRTSGHSNGVDLTHLNWADYGLVVIDESHNFRNDSRSARDSRGSIVRRSRYERLLEDVIHAGGKTRVLMLSATPVNTSLLDLRNQIRLMTGKREDAFDQDLGINNLSSMFARAQKRFKSWDQHSGERDKRDLMEVLSGDFFALLDAVSIARSRRHVQYFYPDVVARLGGFPKQARPVTESPGTDLKGALSYEALNAAITKFQLSIYTPSKYVVSKEAKKRLATEKARHRFNQATREVWLLGMIRINLLKRLESAASSLVLTLQRTVAKIDQLVTRIEKYQATEDQILATVEADQWEEQLEAEHHEDEEFIVNKARHPYHFNDLDLPRWLVDLRKDRAVLQGVYDKVAQIDPTRDGKLCALKARLLDKLKNPVLDRDGRLNRKVLVFTVFKDTAEYLYEQLEPLLTEHGAHCAMLAGDTTHTSYGINRFNDILTNFAPIGRARYPRDDAGKPLPDGKPEIDILFATDCVSEGQNLQDCDLVVNYDIHWNPVRLVQRFGRIDRIGSRNHQVGMVNYWPTEDLDLYLKLQGRVQARMALVDAAATGDDPLAADAMGEQITTELNFRDTQLKRLRQENLNLDDLGDGVSMSDFSLDDFLAQLMNYLEENASELENTPRGAYAVADCGEHSAHSAVTPGVIFCLRHRNPSQTARSRNPLQPYYLIYVRADGKIRYNYMNAKQSLELFANLAHGKRDPLLHLCEVFDRETDNGKDMSEYDKLLTCAFGAISQQFDTGEADALTSRGGVLSRKSEQPRGGNDFELVSWLVIKDGKAITDVSAK